MLEDINKRQKKKYIISIASISTMGVVIFSFSLMVGQYGFISIKELFAMVCNIFGANYELPNSYQNIIEFIRLPRTLASFFIGGALSVSGLVYQNTFNNKLISPDILGVSAGCCVGAGIAILLGMSGAYISVFAFIFGFVAVIIALLLPTLFKNKSTITLVLSGIIVGAFMNSIIGLIKYLADKNEKLGTITFWIMGSVTGKSIKDVVCVLPAIIIPFIILVMMSNRIDVISLGLEQSQSLGVNYKRNRLIVVICSTLLTAASVSISGNVGWIGLVIPHIIRALVGNRTKDSIILSFLFGGCFMMIVDVLSRTLSKDDIPLSIITGIFGAIIYSVVLCKRGRNISE